MWCGETRRQACRQMRVPLWRGHGERSARQNRQGTERRRRKSCGRLISGCTTRLKLFQQPLSMCLGPRSPHLAPSSPSPILPLAAPRPSPPPSVGHHTTMDSSQSQRSTPEIPPKSVIPPPFHRLADRCLHRKPPVVRGARACTVCRAAKVSILIL